MREYASTLKDTKLREADGLDDFNISRLKSAVRVGIKMADEDNWENGIYKGDAQKYVDIAMYQIDTWANKQPKQDTKLREAAEKVVYEWHNSVGEECIDAAMVELVKVLNSKKH